MNKHYIFWPFSARSGTDLGGTPVGAGRAMREFRLPDKSVKFVRYGSRKHRQGLASCNAPDKSLYVTGHGTRGSLFISPRSDAAGELLHAMVVVGRLMEYGLKKSTQCKLKLFTCYSGDSGGGDWSFALGVLYCLRQFGYNSIRVFGYTEAVAPYCGYQHTVYRNAYGIWAKASRVRVQMLDTQIPDLGDDDDDDDGF